MYCRAKNIKMGNNEYKEVRIKSRVIISMV